MKKTAITLIVIGIAVVVGANLYTGSLPEPVPPRVADGTTLRSTTAGDVVGFRDRMGARAWQGIGYARPPVGERRWRAPLEPAAYEEVFEALAPGNVCPQFASLLNSDDDEFTSGAVVGDEDCLYLNVWSPPNAVDLPVMFWIHGGGNSIGHGGSYNGAALAVERDVVVITINYRLGVFGWFAHPDLASGDPLDDSGNYGNLDVIRALQWTQANIDQFGGDPNNVTVFGESAGGTNTLAMLASPLAAGLLHRAIVQSGGFDATTMTRAQAYSEDGGHDRSARELVAHLLVNDGTVADRAAAKAHQADMGRDQLRAYLMSKPAAEILTTLNDGMYGMVDLPEVFADGHVLPDLPSEEIFSDPDNHNMVPIVLGTNRDEPTTFMIFDPTHVTRWLGILARLRDEDTYRRLVHYGAQSWKERGVDRIAAQMTQAGNPNVYAYRFDWDEEPSRLGFDLGTALGAGHGLEIAFAFNDFEGGFGIGYLYPDDEAQHALASSMTSYWSEFAHNGDPGRGRDGNETHWLAWGTNGKHSIILDTPEDQGIYMDDERVTIASVKQALAADSGFSDPVDQCAVYANNFRGEHFEQAEFEALNSACAGIDPVSLRWF